MTTNKDEIESDLKKKLRKNGLNPEVWGKHFASQGFINCLQTQFATDVDKNKIKDESKYEWEKHAVEACFLKSEVNETKDDKLDEQLTKTVDSLRESMTKLTDVLGENERRQRTAINFNEALSHKELHTSLTKFDVSGSVLTSRKPLTSLNLVKKISEGKILRGCYHHKDMVYSVLPRRKLINIQDGNVNLMLTTTPEQYESYEFFKQTHSQVFEHVITHWGLKAAIGARHGFGAFSFNINFKGNKFMTDSTNDTSEFTAYTEINDLLTISIASFSLADVKHYISDEAIAELKKIEENPEKDKTSACNSFFEEFGSHYFTGTYTFGGRFSRSVICHSNDKMSKSDSLNLVKKARPASLSGLFQGMFFSAEGENVDIKDEDHGDLKKGEDFKVEKKHKMTGGPPEVDQLSQWRKGLVESNKTWAIIDQDTLTAKWRSVWDLLTDDNAYQFTDIAGLRNALKSAWENNGSAKEPTETRSSVYRTLCYK